MTLYFFIGLGVVYAAALAALLWVAKKSRSLYAAAKGVCSGLFVLGGIAAFYWGSGTATAQFVFMMLGLVFCALGDILLGVANRKATHVSKKPFLAGAGCFSLAHVLFCVFFYCRAPFHWYDVLFPLVCLGAIRLMEAKDWIRLKSMRPVGYLYTFLVGLMAAKAVEGAAYGPVAGNWVLAIGASLFFLSDLILLFLYFGTKRVRLLRGANLVTYYIGVYMMALSALWL